MNNIAWEHPDWLATPRAQFAMRAAGDPAWNDRDGVWKAYCLWRLSARPVELADHFFGAMQREAKIAVRTLFDKDETEKRAVVLEFEHEGKKLRMEVKVYH